MKASTSNMTGSWGLPIARHLPQKQRPFDTPRVNTRLTVSEVEFTMPTTAGGQGSQLQLGVTRDE